MRLLFISFLIVLAGCTSARMQPKEISLLEQASASGELTACASDKDCISVKDGCCGCNMGGGNKSINQKFLPLWESDLSKKCDGMFCLAVIRQPCPGKAMCVSSECVLK